METNAIMLFWILVSLISGCAIPGREYPVSPMISGDVYGDGSADRRATLILRVAHRESPDLQKEKRTFPERDEATSTTHFSFAPVKLEVAGHEYSKHYRVSLTLEAAGRDRVIWRADLSRRALDRTIELDCDLDRAPHYGLPCRVRDPLQHPWLVAEGERTFRRLCVDCHGIDGRGNPAFHAEPGKRPPDLRRIAVRNAGRFDRVAVADWIDGRRLPSAHGTRRMPIWGERLSAEYQRYSNVDAVVGATLDPLVTYLESLQEAD